MAYDFNKNFSQGYGRTGRLSFQGGGRAGPIDYAGTSGMYNRFLLEGGQEPLTSRDMMLYNAIGNPGLAGRPGAESAALYDARSELGQQFGRDALLTQAILSQGPNPALIEALSPVGRKVYESLYYKPEPPSPSGGVQGFQGGGRAGTAFGLHSAGIETQRDLEEQAKDQAERQGKWGLWGNLLGIGAGIAGSMLLPGLGGMIAPKLGTFLAGSGTGTGFLGSALGKALGRGVASAVPKALTKYAVASSYKPEEFTSKTGFGLDKYRQLTDRGSAFRTRGQEVAGVGMLTDIGTAMMPNPFTGKPMGTMSEQFGIGPVEWGGYTPTADMRNYMLNNPLDLSRVPTYNNWTT